MDAAALLRRRSADGVTAKAFLFRDTRVIVDQVDSHRSAPFEDVASWDCQ